MHISFMTLSNRNTFKKYLMQIFFYPVCFGGLTIQLALRIGLIIPCKKTKTLELKINTQLA